MSKPDRKRPAGKSGDAWVPDFDAVFGTDRRSALQLAFTWRLMIASRKWRTQVDERMAQIHQTHARYEVLSVIKFAPPHISQRDLARYARLENPTLVRILDRLELDGLVIRSPNDTDSRVKTVCLTALGEETLNRQLDIGQELRYEFLAQLSDEELAIAASILDKFIDTL